MFPCHFLWRWQSYKNKFLLQNTNIKCQITWRFFIHCRLNKLLCKLKAFFLLSNFYRIVLQERPNPIQLMVRDVSNWSVPFQMLLIKSDINNWNSVRDSVTQTNKLKLFVIFGLKIYLYTHSTVIWKCHKLRPRHQYNVEMFKSVVSNLFQCTYHLE